MNLPCSAGEVVPTKTSCRAPTSVDRAQRLFQIATTPRCRMLFAAKSRGRLVDTRPGHTTLTIGEGLGNSVSMETERLKLQELPCRILEENQVYLPSG